MTIKRNPITKRASRFGDVRRALDGTSFGDPLPIRAYLTRYVEQEQQSINKAQRRLAQALMAGHVAVIERPHCARQVFWNRTPNHQPEDTDDHPETFQAQVRTDDDQV